MFSGEVGRYCSSVHHSLYLPHQLRGDVPPVVNLASFTHTMFSLHGHYNLVPCVELCVCVCMQLLCTRIIQLTFTQHLHMQKCVCLCIRCVNGPVQLLSTTVHTHTHIHTMTRHNITKSLSNTDMKGLSL